MQEILKQETGGGGLFEPYTYIRTDVLPERLTSRGKFKIMGTYDVRITDEARPGVRSHQQKAGTGVEKGRRPLRRLTAMSPCGGIRGCMIRIHQAQVLKQDRNRRRGETLPVQFPVRGLLVVTESPVRKGNEWSSSGSGDTGKLWSNKQPKFPSGLKKKKCGRKVRGPMNGDPQSGKGSYNQRLLVQGG